MLIDTVNNFGCCRARSSELYKIFVNLVKKCKERSTAVRAIYRCRSMDSSSYLSLNLAQKLIRWALTNSSWIENWFRVIAIDFNLKHLFESIISK